MKPEPLGPHALNPEATRPAKQLPAAHLDTDQGPMTVRRAWPVPGAAEPTLAVELDDGRRLRAGWFCGGQVSLIPAGTDPKLRALAGAAADGVVVSHRPGKRAVVRSANAQNYVKIVKRGKASGVVNGVARAGSFASAFRTPKVLASTEATVTFAAISGQSLHAADSFSAEQWRQAWTAICDAWVQSVGHPAAISGSRAAVAGKNGVDHGLIHRAEAETGVLRHWYQAVLPWLEDPAAAAHAVEDLAGLLASLPEERLRPAHRDLHDKQLLWCQQTGPGLLDVDTACWADPALDLGNLRAHALLRRLQGVWTASQAETVTFCVDQAAHGVGAAMPTVAVYEQSALLRLGFVYAVRPQYAALAARLRERRQLIGT